MAGMSLAEIGHRIVEAIAESGAVGLSVPNGAGNPRKFLISSGSGTLSLWAYAWTLTHGGRPSLPDEYRIQMTTVASPLPANPDGYTVLLGYEPNLQLFAGFDLRRHALFTEGSPSVQVDIRQMRQALQDGLSFDRKANDEIAVGVRPDLFLFYCLHAGELHEAGENDGTLGVLSKASQMKPVADSELATLSRERRRLVREVSQVARSASFRMRVLQAYGFRCAVTRGQMRLVEAAHILPVSFGQGSVDDVRNGIALSPTYHRAFDVGLIYLDHALNMRLNEARTTELRRMNLDAGIPALAESLGRIHVPADPRQYPAAQFVRLANQYREIEVAGAGGCAS